jgi:BlaI family penicillinase repressor
MPRRPAGDQLTPLELEIMKILWEDGPTGVQAVQQRLGRGDAYTTVQTMLNVLVRKGKAKRTMVDRAYRYRAAVSREKAIGQALRDVVDRVFGGSAEALVMSLVDTRQLTPQTLRRLHELIEKERK